MIADEMFDDLGLWLEHENGIEFEVKNDDNKVIKIDKANKAISCYNYYYEFEWVTMQELQAINQKCKELGWFKKSRKEYLKKYYSNNKEKLKERNKQYYQDNKEKINEKNREYYRKNREKILERNKQYYRKNNPVQDKFSFYNV